MITRIKLENFRRHADTEIVIGEGEQIIAVSGRNGSGKSTILEAIVFALFGQSRHGNRGLDGLIRDGAELEGMAVELDFTVDSDLYSVTRRRDGKAVSAVLSVNDIPLHTGTREVTAAIVNLLGTDAAGFKLAAVAQQKELDALIRLGPTERVKSISKLLRLDAVTRAKEEMGRRHSKFVTSMKALPTPADRADRTAEIAALEAAVAAAQAGHAQASAEVAQYSADISNAGTVEREYQEATRKLMNAESALRAATQAAASARSELEAVVIPADVPEGEDVHTATGRLMSVAGELVAAEQAARSQADAKQVEEELQRCEATLSELNASIEGSTRESVLAAVEEAEASVVVAQKNTEEKTAAHSEASSNLGARTATLTAAQKRRNAIEALGDECESCGQGITAEHKHHTADLAQQQVEEATAALEQAQRELDAASSDLAASETALAGARAAAEAASSAVTKFFNATASISETERRIGVYTARLSRFSSESGVDLDGLREAKMSAEAAVKDAEERKSAEQARLQAVKHQEFLADRLQDANAAVTAAEQQVSACAVDAELVEAWERLREANTKYTEALRVAGERAAQVETVRGELSTLNATVSQEEKILCRLQEFQRDGATHALAKRLLTGLETKVGSGVVPSLQSSASEILDAMSDGRYCDLKLDAKYTPSVSDNGVWRPVQDLSGGEQDLVALALRLAVAELISSRNTTGFGFLILDEVLGSQDGQRRESILSSLRALKRRYGQVWCISHVGGVEDVADRVIEIEVDDDGVATAF